MDIRKPIAYAIAGVKFGAKVLTKVGCTAGGLVLGVKAGEVISRSTDEDTATVVTFAAGATGAMLGSIVGDGVIAVAKAVAAPDEDEEDDVTVDVNVEGDDADDDEGEDMEGFDPYCSDCPYREDGCSDDTAPKTGAEEKDGDTEDVGTTFPDPAQQGSDDATSAEQPAEPPAAAAADEELLPSVPAEGTAVTEPVADDDPADSTAAVEVDPAEAFVEAASLDPDGAVKDLLDKQNIIQTHQEKQLRRNADAHKGDRKFNKFN